MNHNIAAFGQAETSLWQRNRELEALLNLSSVLTGRYDLDSILDSIAHAARDLVAGADRASLWLVDSRRNQMVLRAGAGFSEKVPVGYSVGPDISMIGWVYRMGQTIYVPDTSRALEFALLGNNELDQVRSVLGVPLILEGVVIGSLFVDSISRANTFKQDDTRPLQTLAGSAAVAIQDAQLYERLQEELADRVRAEEALRRSEERFRRIAENAPVMIFRWTRGQGFEYVSPAATQITGYHPEEFYSQPDLMHRLIHPEDSATLTRIFDDVISDTLLRSGTMRSLTKAGRIVHIEIRGVPLLDERSQVIGVEGIAYDVSQYVVTRARLRELGQRLARAQDRERQRVALELHNEVGQMLTVAKMRLSMALKGLPGDNPALEERLTGLVGLVDESLELVRSISHELHPPLLAEMGWQPAIGWLCESLSNRTGAKIDYRHHGHRPRLDPDTEIAIYRVVQEALTNALRHAIATQVTVTSRVARRQLKIRVEDNGRGFDVESIRTAMQPGIGLGLLSMQERADAVAADLSIQSKVGRGSVVTLRVPLSAVKVGQ